MYYPNQRSVSPLTVIRRECLLPDEASGVVRISEGKRVDIRDVVAQGVVATGYTIIEAASFFGFRRPEQLDDYLLVEPGDTVNAQQVLAGKNPNRGKRLFSPINGIVSQIDNGRIILQEIPDLIDLEAGARGRISRVQPGRGVIIEAVGAHVQGVWGNGRRTIATLRLEPQNGLEQASGDVLEMRYMGAVVVTRQPLTDTGLAIMQEQNFAGIIAPSMDSQLRARALRAEASIVLTEGFGSTRMNIAVFNLLSDFEGQQATIDAHTPTRWDMRYPEVIVNIQARREQPPARPNIMMTLRPGMNVLVTRHPHLGLVGSVLDLPKTPTLLDNGLRVPCAQVELVTGETVFVPLANLEVLSR